MARIIKLTLAIIFLFGMTTTQTSCMSQKTEFSKKKYKIRKGMPPAQRYFNKYTIFERKSNYPKTRRPGVRE